MSRKSHAGGPEWRFLHARPLRLARPSGNKKGSTKKDIFPSIPETLHFAELVDYF